ncbi:hypothetical protein [Nocardiopsis rhodophaea]
MGPLISFLALVVVAAIIAWILREHRSDIARARSTFDRRSRR